MEKNLLPDGSETRGVYQSVLLDTESYVESVGEYILPDYEAEIRKILAVRTEIVDSERYESGGRILASGTLRHCVIYTDGEGCPASVTVTADYDYSLPLSEEGVPLSILADERVVTVLPRLSGPRKLAVKTRLYTHVTALSEGEMPAFLGTVSEAPEVLYAPVTVGEKFHASDEYTYLADLRVPTDTPDGVRVLLSEGVVALSEVRSATDVLHLTGDVILSFLLDDGGTAFPMTAKIPFEETLSVPGASGGMAVGDGRVSNVACELSPDGEGGAVLSATATVLLSGVAGENSTTAVAVDAFSTTHSLTPSYTAIPLSEVAAMKNGTFSVEGSIPREGTDAADATSVVTAFAFPESTHVHIEGTRVVFTGDCRVNAILGAVMGEKPTYLAQVFTLPFRGEAVCPSLTGEEAVSGSLRFEGCRLSIDGGRLAFSANALYTVQAERKKQVSVLSGLSEDGVRENGGGARIVAVYPEPGDTLWSIAKEQGVSPRAIAKTNRLPDGVLLSPASEESLGGAARILLLK